MTALADTPASTPTTEEALSARRAKSPTFPSASSEGRPIKSCRNSTYAAVLDELDEVKSSPQVAAKLSEGATDPQPAKEAASLPLTELALAVPVSIVISSIVGGSTPASWGLLLSVLVTMAVILLGVSTVRRIYRDWKARPSPGPDASWLDIPLTDATLDVASANKLANSAQVREKGLKIVQYVLKAGAYSELFPKEAAKHLKTLAKTTSTARRFFKFARWIKHFDDYLAAKDEKDGTMRLLLYIRVAANLGADWAEDVCSLERIGFLPKGTLSVGFMLFAEYCQMALALIEMGLSAVMVRKQQQVSVLAEGKAGLKQQRKLAMMRLELIKFVSDLGKAIYDCELHFAHEGLFIGCSLFSALISTHKNIFKVLTK